MQAKWLGIIGSTFFSLGAIAGTMGDLDEYQDETAPACHKTITVSGGPVWYAGGEIAHQSLALTPGNFYIYSPDKPTDILGYGEVFFALNKPVSPLLAGELGIALGYSGNAGVRGTFITNGPGTNLNNYLYKIKNYRVGMKGKLLGEYGFWVKPYLSATLGVGFNDAYSYFSNPLVAGQTTPPPFADNTTIAFTYAAGIGLEAMVSPQWRIGVGYEFGDWGKSELGAIATPIQGITPLNQGLKLDNFYTHTALASISYII